MHISTKRPFMNLKEYKTFCVILGSIVLGHNFGIMGPTLVHLEYLFRTDTQSMAMAYTAGYVGGFIGAIVCGFLFDQYDCDYQFAVSFLLMGLSTSAATWMPSTGLYSLVMAMRQFLISYISTGMTPYIINMWHGSKYKNAIFQMSDTAWSIGSFAVPLVTLPFLAPLPGKKTYLLNKYVNPYIKPEDTVVDYSDEIVLNYDNHELSTTRATTTQLPIPHEIYTVRYPYMIIGASAIVVSFLFTLAKKPNRTTQIHTSEGTTLNDNFSKRMTTLSNLSYRYNLKLILKILIFTYACFIVWQGTVLGTFLSVFVIKGLGWPVKNGPLITSLFRGSQGIGRLCGIVTSLYLNPSQILAINMLIGVFAYCQMILAVCVIHSNRLVWFSTVMAGLSVSNSFPMAVLWGTQYLQAKASYSSLIGVALSVGTMTSASLAGYLFQNYSHTSVIYLLMFASIFNILLFCVMQVASKVHSDSLYS